MKTVSVFLFSSILMSLAWVAEARIVRYGERLCGDPGFYCIRVERGDSWSRLWPDDEQRDLVMRLNRMNIALSVGMVIVVPEQLSKLSVWDISPFPLKTEPNHRKTIVVNQNELAWGAYNKTGELVWWGPISSGKDFCRDVGKSCETVVGEFDIFRKSDAGCISTKFPLPYGGAEMPYCMFFHGGYAFHGSPSVPGYRASHGCVRLFNEDAEWLNREFVDLPGQGKPSTKVIVHQ